MMNRILYVLFVIFVFSVEAQGVMTSVSGVIRNPNYPEIKLNIDERYINNLLVTYKAAVIEGTFRIDLDLERAQVVTLNYGQHQAEVFLNPGKQVSFETDGFTFRESMRFVGADKADNDCYKMYLNQFKSKYSPFDMVQLKKGMYYYKVYPDIRDRMNDMEQIGFKSRTDSDRRMRKDFVESYNRSHEMSLSNEFMKYMYGKADFDWAGKMLLYHFAYKYKHNVSDSFRDFMYEVEVPNDALLVLPEYREYIIGLVNYNYDLQNPGGGAYAGQYMMAKQMLSGESLALVQSYWLAKAFKQGGDLSPIYTLYSDFIETNQYIAYNQPISDAYESASKYALGAPAPDFTLQTAEGNTISLSQYRGKVVYVNFWASWCRPCVNKLNTLSDISQKYSSDDVVFINVSMDRTRDAWINYLTTHNAFGVNGYTADAYESSLVKLYDVKAIPAAFIINRNGTFAEKPKTGELGELLSIIDKLVTNK
jgi:peroxiredoxin